VVRSTNEAIVASFNDQCCCHIIGSVVIFGLVHLAGLYRPLMPE
jgi:hypothetical protein